MSFEIVFVTGNANKVLEARGILGDQVNLKQVEVDLEEIQAVELEEVVSHKLMQAYEQVGKPLFCEDTGLYIKGLNGFPGALIKFYLERLGPEGICSLHGGDSAYGKTVVGYHDGKEMHFFSGVTQGSIAKMPRGEGFGWSTIFVPHIGEKDNEKTFAEMPIALKNEVSMRGEALRKMLACLGW